MSAIEDRKSNKGYRTDDFTQAEVDSAIASIPAVRAGVGPFYSLSFRNFRLFFVGQMISVAGTWMQMAAQNWVVWDLTRDARMLGVVSGASAIPYVAFSMWGGQVADRYSKRDTLVWTQTLSMILAFLLAILASGRWIPLNVWHIVGLAALSGIVNAFNMPAQQAFVTEMVDDRQALSNAIALSSLRFNLARVVGPLVAGVILVKLGAAACFGVNGISYIAVIISLLMMRLKPFIPHPTKLNVWEGFSYIGTTPRVLRAVLLVGTASLFAWSTSTLYPMISSNLGMKAAGYSQMLTFNGIGAAVGAGALALLGDRIPRRYLIYGGAFIFCISLLLLAQSVFFPIILATLVIGGVAMIVFGMSSNVGVQEQVPDLLRGRVMAVYTLVFQGVMPLGSMEIGFLAQRFGASTAITINSTIFLFTTIGIFAWSLISLRPPNLQSKTPPNSQ